MALLTRAGALTELRRTDEAVQLYTRAAAAFRTSIAASASDPESFLELAKRSGTDRTAAIQYAENGLKIDPEHRGLRNFLNGLRSDAEQPARQARIAAARGGAAADRTASFSRAEDRLREGTRLSAPSQIRESLAAYADAQRLYSQALEEAASAQREGERIRGEVQAHIAQARRHIDAHDLPRAREELGQADRRMPGSPEVVALRRDITAAEALERETAIGGVLAQAKGISTPSERIKVLRQGLDRFPNEPRITQALAAATESLREPANPPPAPPTVRSIPVATVQTLLDAYFGAYQTLDFNALKAVFPNASDFDRRRLAALRDQFRSCAYERGEPTITPVSESQAFAEIVVKETCSPKIRAPQRPVTNTQTFRFEKRGADWVIRTGPG
jgi:tetratricopeptide (TPR) repeat protein